MPDLDDGYVCWDLDDDQRGQVVRVDDGSGRRWAVLAPNPVQRELLAAADESAPGWRTVTCRRQ